MQPASLSGSMAVDPWEPSLQKKREVLTLQAAVSWLLAFVWRWSGCECESMARYLEAGLDALSHKSGHKASDLHQSSPEGHLYDIVSAGGVVVPHTQYAAIDFCLFPPCHMLLRGDRQFV